MYKRLQKNGFQKLLCFRLFFEPRSRISEKAPKTHQLLDNNSVFKGVAGCSDSTQIEADKKIMVATGKTLYEVFMTT